MFAHVCSPVFYLQYEKLHISSECNGFAAGKFIKTVKYTVMWQSWQHWANPWVFNTDTHIPDRCMWIRTTAELISHTPLNNVGLRVTATTEKSMWRPRCECVFSFTLHWQPIAHRTKHQREIWSELKLYCLCWYESINRPDNHLDTFLI